MQLVAHFYLMFHTHSNMYHNVNIGSKMILVALTPALLCNKILIRIKYIISW